MLALRLLPTFPILHQLKAHDTSLRPALHYVNMAAVAYDPRCVYRLVYYHIFLLGRCRGIVQRSSRHMRSYRRFCIWYAYAKRYVDWPFDTFSPAFDAVVIDSSRLAETKIRCLHCHSMKVRCGASVLASSSKRRWLEASWHPRWISMNCWNTESRRIEARRWRRI